MSVFAYLLMSSVVLDTFVWAHGPVEFHDFSPRLIQFAPGKKKWMDPDQIAELAEKNHRAGSCGGFMDITERPDHRRAEVMVQTSLSRADLEPAMPQEVAAILDRISEQRYEETIEHLQSYWNRYYTTRQAVDSALWIADQFRNAAQGRADVEVQVYQHQGWPQPSVVAKIKGTDTQLNEGIVIGAHEDSINTMVGKRERPKARAPGADDNASGTAAVLEVFRAFLESGLRPVRDIYFMTYAAEEVGLRGSGEIAADFAKRKVKIAGVLNLDMLLYRGPAARMGVTTSNTDARLNLFTEKLIDRYVGAPHERRSCGYSCSDHASWDEEGYPAVFLFETVDDISPWWHHPNDTLNASHEISWAMNFVKAAAAFTVELALRAP